VSAPGKRRKKKHIHEGKKIRKGTEKVEVTKCRRHPVHKSNEIQGKGNRYGKKGSGGKVGDGKGDMVKRDTKNKEGTKNTVNNQL